jgi:hypothetical protein
VRRLYQAAALAVILMVVLVDFASHILSVAVDGSLMAALLYLVWRMPEA